MLVKHAVVSAVVGPLTTHAVRLDLDPLAAILVFDYTGPLRKRLELGRREVAGLVDLLEVVRVRDSEVYALVGLRDNRRVE